MGILVSKKNQEKKISDAGQLSEKRVIAVHIIKDDSTFQTTTTDIFSSDDSTIVVEPETVNSHSNASDAQPKVDGNILSVLKGDLTNYAIFKAKIVRIFISSTFTDTAVERNALMQDVYPRLKKFCQEHGYEFQVVDMRWGIRDESMDEHETLELCIREIENCQKFSTGPSFVSLLSEKYGFRPIPARIFKDEFRAISSAISTESDFQVVLSWYHLDENHKPPVYVLQPISSRIPDFINCTNEAARQLAVKEWLDTMSKISKILRNAASLVLFGSEKRKYFASISEIELEKGIIETNNLVNGCWWFKRNINGLKEAGDEEAEKYLDCKDEESEETEMCLANLHNRLLNRMDESNIKQYRINWNPKGVNIEDEEHAHYLSNLCQDVYDLISSAVEKTIHERSKNEVNLAVFEEASQHITFAKARCETFHGRKEVLEKIRSYLEGSDAYPLVVYGESGCGKTSVLSMMLKCCQEWFCNDGAIVIRHLGITPDSSLVRRLLSSLCQQIALLIGQNYDTKQRKILKVLADDFTNFLQSCKLHFSAENPLIIILDSLDQLSPEDGAFQLTWLPIRLPPWVKMIISTISNDKYNCLKNVKGLIPDRFFVEIPRLPLDDAVKIVNSWLSTNKRTLKESQRDVLLDAFQKCSLPIFLKVSFEEALRWKSYTPTDEIRLESTVRGAINGLFERIEKRHGKVFVSRTLAYITAAKSGLTESELEDILSCDDDVLEDVFQYWVPPVRRIPPLLWLRMKHDLSSYLVDRGADESMVVTWYHRQFREAAHERYLSDVQEKIYVHTSIGEFFLGRWANGVKKPFKDKHGSMQFMERLVASQNLIFSPEDHCHHGPTSFNLRKLNELPFQLVMSENLNVLKEECLCNYEFLLTQLRARGLSEVLDNFELALSVWPGDKDLMIIHETMKLSTNALMLWPGQLASQLLSRIPKSSILKSEFLQPLEKQARSPSLLALVPTTTCLTSPGGPLLQSLSGSTEAHVSLRLSRDGKTLVSIGERNEMLVWDIRAGRVVRNMECPDGGTTYSCLTSKGDIAIASRLGVIKAWYVSNGQPLFEIRDHHELAPISICVFNKTEALVTYASEALQIIELENGDILKQYATKISHYSNKSSRIFLSSLEGICLVVHKDAVTETENSLLVEVFHISSKDKHEIFRVRTENDIMALDIVNPTQILVTYVNLEEDLNKYRKPTARPSVASSWQNMTLELWDMETMKPKTLLTAADESVRCTCITPDRDEIIMLCDTSFLETAAEYLCFVKIYSVADGKSLKLPLSFPSGIISMCGLGFTCLVTASADKIIRVWDLERSSDMVSRARKKSEYVDIGDKMLNSEQKNGDEAHVINGLQNDTSMATAPLSDPNKQRVEESDTSELTTEHLNSNSGVGNSDALQCVASNKRDVVANEEKESSSLPSNGEVTSRGSRNHWKQAKALPVGKNFLKLRYSTLSTALKSFDIDTGDCLEDFQVIYCHDDIIVYLARRMVDSVYAVVAWKLSSDVKMRVSELKNPDACIVKAGPTYYLVVMAASVISVYNANTGESVKCKQVKIDNHGSERLFSIKKGAVLVIEAGRKSLKVLSVPNLDVVKTICLDENVIAVRTICNRSSSFFVLCLRKYLPNSTQSEFIAEVWDADALQKMKIYEYKSFESEFNDTQISNDGKILADNVFDPNELRYRLVIWREDSTTFEIVPCDSSLNIFTMNGNGKELLIGTWTGDLLIYDTEKSDLKHMTKAHSSPLHLILTSDTGNKALTIAGVFNSRDRSIRLWNTKNGEMISEFTPDVKVSPITITNNGSLIIVEIRGKFVKMELLSNKLLCC